MGRKRNQGKARKAAKAKAREAAAERGNNNNNRTAGRQIALAALQRCIHPLHGYTDPNLPDIQIRFLDAFGSEFNECCRRGGNITIVDALKTAQNATISEYAAVWNDLAKMKVVISIFLCNGTQDVLEKKYDAARENAAFVRYFEQYIAVVLKESQALFNWPKIEETFQADFHTLVKFFRHRIPCSCLDEKYDEVKSITKISFCYNPQCTIPYGQLERSKTKYCSRCRCAAYCSWECHKADWSRHKPICDKYAATKAQFDARQHNM